MKAFLKNYRQSPRKVRLVADLVKGKKVDEALVQLDFLAKRASLPLKKLLISAIANATQLGKEKENLFVKEFRVDKGIVLKRIMPAAMGSAHRINKRTSQVLVVLAEKEKVEKKQKKAKIQTEKAKKVIPIEKKEDKKTDKKEEKKVIKKVSKVKKSKKE